MGLKIQIFDFFVGGWLDEVWPFFGGNHLEIILIREAIGGM